MNETAIFPGRWRILVSCIVGLAIFRSVVCRKITVGVIGGGVSGMGAARRIAASGNHVATVLEKGPEVVPIQHRVVNHPYVHDMDLLYIPGISWRGYGVEKRWRKLLRKEQVKLSPATAYVLNNGASAVTEVYQNKPFHALAELNQQPLKAFEEACRFIKHLQSFFKKSQYLGVQECLQERIANAGETFGNWYLRHNYTAIGQILVGRMAMFGALPVETGAACSVLMSLSSKLPALLSNILATVVMQYKISGQNTHFLTSQLPTVATEWLQGVIKNGAESQVFYCQDGYASFFRSVVRNMNIDYRTNVHVYKIKPTTSGILVYTKGGSTYKFDKVVVAARPDQAVEFLPNDHPMTNLYHLASQDIHRTMLRYGVYSAGIVTAVPVKDSRVAKTNMTRYVFFVRDIFNNLTKDLVNQDDITVMRVTKKFDGDDLISVLWQTPAGLINTPTESASIVRVLSGLGYEQISFVKMVHYPRTPSHLSTDLMSKDWYEKAKSSQGANNIFFVGEVFSGHGVLTAWLHAEAFVKKMFHLWP